MQKYRCYYKDDFREVYDAMSMQDEHGDWYRVEDVDALIAEKDKLADAISRDCNNTALERNAAQARIAELERKLIKCGIERSWYASKFKQALDIMEVNDPLNARDLKARPAWEDASTGN